MASRLTKTRTLAAVAVAALVGAGYFIWGAVPAKREQTEVARVARPVKTMAVRAAGGGGERIFPGKVLASQKVNLAFRVSGQIAELPAVKGTFVEPGTLLARLDPRDFEVQLANAESELGNAKARLEAMKAGARKEEIAMLTSKVNSARAQMNDALTTLDRVEKLYKAGASPNRSTTRPAPPPRGSPRDLSVGLAGAVGGPHRLAPRGCRRHGFTIQGSREGPHWRTPLPTRKLWPPSAASSPPRDNNQSIQRDQSIVSLQDIGTLEVAIPCRRRSSSHAEKGYQGN